VEIDTLKEQKQAKKISHFVLFNFRTLRETIKKKKQSGPQHHITEFPPWGNALRILFIMRRRTS